MSHLAPCILVASPLLLDPNFLHTVILLVEHDDSGAMGVILNRPGMHINIGQRLADLTSLVKPKLTVVDAVRILVAGGPGGGDLKDVKELDTVIASTDIVAADSYTATLFNMQPSDLSYIVAGAAMGLGRSDLQNLKIEQIPVGS